MEGHLYFLQRGVSCSLSPIPLMVHTHEEGREGWREGGRKGKAYLGL